MLTVENLLASFPTKPNEDAVKKWIGEVLMQSEKAPEVGVGSKKEVKLPEVEAALYRALIQHYGEPRHIEKPKKRKKEYKGANPSLLFKWALGQRYRFGLRLLTVIEADDTMHYLVKR